MVLPPATANALDELCTGLRARFGGRVERLALFGSRARGEANEDSDVDVLVVIEGLTSGEGREVDALVGDLLTRHDVLLSPLLISSEHQVPTPASPLVEPRFLPRPLATS